MTPGDSTPAPLNGCVIAEQCHASGCDVDVHVLQTVDSTNTWLMEGEFVSPLTLCVAEHQTVGRGRRGKTWHSPNSGVTFSLRLNGEKPIARFNGLSLLVGAALCECLRDIGVAHAMVKWPNDVLVNNAKLAGILIESRTVASGDSTIVVIGIGINYRRGNEAKLIDQDSTDLFSLGVDGLPDRSLLIADIVTRIASVLATDVPEAVSDLASRWHTYDALAGADVMASIGTGNVVAGVVAGIDGTGAIQIQTADGIRVLNSADVSLRRRV